MDIDLKRGTELLKALSDETRVRIVHILSCGELCACDIQEYFNLTQPTLSHHLALLVEAGLVTARREGKRAHYSLNGEAFDVLGEFVQTISAASANCDCKKIKGVCDAKK